jgi:hypothetical protein
MTRFTVLGGQPVHGEFLLMQQSPLGITHDNVPQILPAPDPLNFKAT